MIMDLDERKKWDDQVAVNHELYPLDNVDVVNNLLGDSGKYGTCTRVGVGYTRTKQGILSPREQLILGGMQDYSNGSTILWGTEMEEQHNYLLPEGSRQTRAKSHLFAATLSPTSSDSFDVEYLLQMDVGGGVPNFLTTPAITDAVKKLFEHARGYFEEGEADLYLQSLTKEYSEIEAFGSLNDDFSDAEIEISDVHYHLNDNESLLFTP